MIPIASPYPHSVLHTPSTQRVFSGADLLQIAFPLGGIGAGMVCLNGIGGIQDFSIRNKPGLSAVPDGHISCDCAFATLYFPELGIARLVEGPLPPEKVYNQGLKNQGLREGGHEGLPRFRDCLFRGEYPFASVQLSDPRLPLAVEITGFNPFIPLDDRSSSIPCAALEYRLTNATAQRVPYEFAFHLSHFAHDGRGGDFSKTRNALIPGTGAFLYNVDDPNSAAYGSGALGVVGCEPQIKAMWFRGGWFDSLSALWKEISSGGFTANDGAAAATSHGRNGASILLKGELEPGESVVYPIVFSWYFPNVHYTYGQPKTGTDESVFFNTEHGDLPGGCVSPDCACPPPRWRPYYASQWIDARDVLEFVRDNYADLRGRTQSFHDALFSSTLPSYVLDAVSANLDILKSPTVLRQEGGQVWAWEGCFSDSGCCHGSCTHVWNYAQSLAHLFPALERTLREAELAHSMDAVGHISFRAALPDGPTSHTFHAASDGQLGGIMKVYREWQISGDRAWLDAMYPLAKRSLDYCIATWDPDHLGVLVEPHHNTYDIEFWGADGMCSSFYLGALAAMARLAVDAGRPAEAAPYEELGRRGAQYLDEQLFNGEYYQQNAALYGLRASPTPETLEALRASNPEEYALLVQEGPKYQYGSGCISDGVFGAWLARQCFVDTFQNPEKIRRNLQSIFAYNFRPSLWEHANPQRPGYAVGDEPGLLLCSWPRGGKPALPFVYSDEVWTGIEYQVAAHLIAEGLVDEGLTVVKALRSRYDGRVRNPWNEYECGSYYARAMASYGLLTALSGFTYSAASRSLTLAPQLAARPFTCFFSTASGWGTLSLVEDALVVRLEEGCLDLEQVSVTAEGKTLRATPHVCAMPGTTRIALA
jgi:uncharacterized protein (DUF608 family)